MSHSNNIGMNFFARSPPDNYDEVKGRSILTKRNIFRDFSMSSLKSFVAYHEKIELNNIMNENINIDDNSLALSYEAFQKKAFQASKMTEQQANIRNKYNNLDPFKLIL